MKKIELTKGYFALVDNKDFEYLNKWSWHAKVAKRTVYARRDFKKNKKKLNIWMHREILKLTDRDQNVDHIDSNGLNNQKNNLRVCTNSQNSQNMRKHSDNLSGYKGVHFMKSHKLWVAQLTFNYKRVLFSYHKTKEEAALAYNQAALKYHGPYAKLNVINGSIS